MAWASGFFNSINGDRLYNADQMNKIFEGLITNGVFANVGKQLVVEPNNGMVIQINTGRGYFANHWVKNDSEYLQTLEDSDVTLNRYCAVCIRVDETDSGRSAVPYFKYSEFASTPVKPQMTRSETVNEYCLAYIYIKAGASEIKASDIEDTRSITDLCGWVTGLIEQIDTTTLYNQFEAQFLEWFNSLQDYLDENVEAKLIGDIEKLTSDVEEIQSDMAHKTTVTFNGLGWESNSDDVYTQTITVNGITSTSDVFVAPKAEYKTVYERMGCYAESYGANTITFACTQPEDVNVEVEIIYYNFQ